jgi:outer membrane immunogenic protein
LIVKKQFSIATLATMAAFAWAGAANAADMPVKAVPPPPPIYDWSGFYVGFHEGYEWASVHDVQVSNNAGNGFAQDSKVRNGILGFHVGVQKQFVGGPFGRAWVIGLEGGLNEPLNRNNPSNFAPCFNPAFTCGIQNFRDNWYGGARLGLAFTMASGGWLFGGDYLLTVSGGYTTARFQRSDFLLATGVLDAGGGQSVGWHNGGYVGVGLEHLLAKGVLVDWIAGIDYQHQFYSAHTDTSQNFAIAEQHTLNADVDMIRLRTTLKFH